MDNLESNLLSCPEATRREYVKPVLESHGAWNLPDGLIGSCTDPLDPLCDLDGGGPP